MSIIFEALSLSIKKRSANLLNSAQELECSLYADDVTLKVCCASDGHIQDTLQEAIDTVEKCCTPVPRLLI